MWINLRVRLNENVPNQNIEGNVQWVHKTINIMKQSLSDEEFIQYCRTVAKYQDNKNVKMVD